MCRPKGCVFFRRFGLTTGIDLSHFGPESGMVFEEEYEGIWRFRMNKKERVMGKFEKYLKKCFCWRPNLSNNKNRWKAIFNWAAKGIFFWGEGAAIHTRATTKPCR